MITTSTFGMRPPKERTSEGPNGDGNDDNGGGDDGGDDSGDNGDEDPFGLHPMCCQTCRQYIGISTRRSMNVSKTWKR
jgi:hypothetical protein